ncbi:MAG: tRNA pseudouridine(38-40) synthase TruA [Pseudomonadales bacterium]|nr:tRNA pseudouridine(38-40) synthase TruA [Pseudomonadales bacterium]
MSSIIQSVALGVSYYGNEFHGWQYQNETLPTVQGKLESALSIVADEAVRVVCAGRTDARVHATKQVVHFETRVSRPLKAWVFGVNAHLPDAIAVNWSRTVPTVFNARFSASARRYFYLIFNARIRSGLFAGNFTREQRPLDVERMHRAGQHLLGENNFSAFRAANCQSKTPMRNVHHLNVSQRGDLILIDIQANAFLYHMVRNIAAVLMDIGAGQKPENWTEELLRLQDRKQAGMTAAATGLYLVDVCYPDFPQIPAGPALPHFFSQLAVD